MNPTAALDQKTLKTIHLIAICGTGMGSLAMLLKDRGYTVTGSDQNVYPPMSTELQKKGITLFEGYKAENLAHKPDLVIVGNAVSKTNPEVEELLRLGLPYYSFPQALSQFFITGKESVVVAGTHGKTTTTALISQMLMELKADPSYLVGGILQDGQKNCRLGGGNYFVIEGDEYDTAFFDKKSKFLHYQPYYTLITSLEFDHADIYRDLEHMTESFRELLAIGNPRGLTLACTHYPKLLEILPLSKAPVQTYGLDSGDWQAHDITYSSNTTDFDVLYKGKKIIRLASPMAGSHNVLNTLVMFALLVHLKFTPDQIQRALSTFKGVKRRQEIKGIINDVVVMDDFAHHPTAVLETIAAVKKKFAGYKMWAVFEPRSNSSKRDIFQADYAKAFDEADNVILSDVFMPEKIKDGKILDMQKLAHDITARGIKAQNISGVDTIVDEIKKTVQPKTVLLIMSNGGFGGIHDKVIQALQS